MRVRSISCNFDGGVMTLIAGRTREETWLKAARHLQGCAEWEDYNVILEVGEPGARDPADAAIEAAVNALLRGAGALPVNSVAETIFPANEYKLHRERGVYEIYPDEVFPKIRPLLCWGTYAHRLVRRKGRDQKPMNPLQICIEKMRKQLAKAKGLKPACYELSLSGDDDEFYELPLYRPADDQKQTLGLPCLSHISLKITRDRRLNLTALYRSHYYIERALGNLLGLARLQHFICQQTGLAPGVLVCVSTHACLDTAAGRAKTRVNELLTKLTTLAAA